MAVGAACETGARLPLACRSRELVVLLHAEVSQVGLTLRQLRPSRPGLTSIFQYADCSYSNVRFLVRVRRELVALLHPVVGRVGFGGLVLAPGTKLYPLPQALLPDAQCIL